MYKSFGGVEHSPQSQPPRKFFKFLVLTKLIPVCPWTTPPKLLSPAPPDFLLLTCHPRWPKGRNPILSASWGKERWRTPPQVTGLFAMPPAAWALLKGWCTPRDTCGSAATMPGSASLQSAAQIWKGSLISGLSCDVPHRKPFLSWGPKLHRLREKQKPDEYGKSSMILTLQKLSEYSSPHVSYSHHRTGVNRAPCWQVFLSLGLLF